MSKKSIFEALDHSQAHADLAIYRFQLAGVDVDADTPLSYLYIDGVHKFVAENGHSVEIWSPIPPPSVEEVLAAEAAPKRRRRAEPAA